MISQSLNAFLKKRSRYNILIFNLILWVASFFTLLFFFAESNNPQKIDFFYTSIFLITIIIPVLINLYLLIPLLLSKERHLLFGLFFLVNLLIFTELNKWVFNSFIDVIFSDFYFVSYHSNTALFFIFSIFLIGTTLLKLSEDWFRLNRAKNKVLELEKMEVENQLNSLKSQINPHFLFNSLNVLYALSLENKKEVSSAILDLSTILRYVLYETGEQKITLEQEVELIQKYLEFQKYRFQDTTSVQFEVSIDEMSYKIHPMLLLPLIENSFKHGMHGSTQNALIHICMKKNKYNFSFCIQNNVPMETSLGNEKYSGLGLKNIRQTLNLIYPDNHSFKIDDRIHSFSVTLVIKLDGY